MLYTKSTTDRRKNVYTINVTSKAGCRAVDVQTYSNKKDAMARLERMERIWFGGDNGDFARENFSIELFTTKLERPFKC